MYNTQIHFFYEKNHAQLLLGNSKCLWKLRFSANLMTHLNKFNVQGDPKQRCNILCSKKAFSAQNLILLPKYC